MAFKEEPSAIFNAGNEIIVVHVCDDGSQGYADDGSARTVHRASFQAGTGIVGYGPTAHDAARNLATVLEQFAAQVRESAGHLMEMQLIAEKMRSNDRTSS
jgi:hypothetical protein